MAAKREPSAKQRKNRGHENLKKGHPWKKGQSGNPSGRPRNQHCMTALMRADINNRVPKTPLFVAALAGLGLKPGCTFIQMTVRSTFINAAKGNAAALKEVWDRMDGKVPIPVQGVEGGVPIGVDVTIGSGLNKILKGLDEMDSRMRRAGI